MGITLQTVGKAAVAKVEGDLDREGLEELDAALAEVVTGERARLIIDLSRCGRLTSDGLRRVVALARLVEGRGGRFALAGAAGEIQRALAIAGIDRLVAVEPSVEAAVTAFQHDRRVEALSALVADLLARAEARA